MLGSVWKFGVCVSCISIGGNLRCSSTWIDWVCMALVTSAMIVIRGLIII